MKATRRIVKRTCRRMSITFSGKEFLEEVQYVVQRFVNQGWDTESYSDGLGDRKPAIFHSEEEALAFVNGEFGKVIDEVIWTNEQ